MLALSFSGHRGAVDFIGKTRGRAYWNDSDMGLTKGEYKIVHLLVSNVGRYVTYRAIYDRLHYEGLIAGSGVHGLIRPWIA
jgi:DNA-binding response OmpR family regulator